MSRLAARIERQRLAVEQARLAGGVRRDALGPDFRRRVERALGGSAGSGRIVVASTGADPGRLRGIPAIGPSVSGAIRGTDPERAVMGRMGTVGRNGP